MRFADRVIIALAAFAAVTAGAVAGVEYLQGRKADKREQAIAMTGGTPENAPAIMGQFGCSGCHAIPGIRGPGGLVGPPLKDISRRVYIGGGLPNTPDNMIRWLLDPPAVDPKTAMPVTGISESQARDIAAYLYFRS